MKAVLALLLCLLALGVITTVILQEQSVAPVQTTADMASAVHVESAPATVDLAQEESAEAESEGCLTELQAGMGFLQEILYMEKVSLHGEYADSYIGNTAFQLEALASQGDSAAMTILGVQYFLAAHGLDPMGAPALLNPMAMIEKRHSDHQAHERLLLPRKQAYTEDQLELMAQARFWLMESVLHGRYLAMELVGTIDGRVAGNAVGQGWINQQDFDELSRNDQASTHPGHVFRQAGLMLLPEGGDGILLGIAFAASRLTDRGNAMAAMVAARVADTQLERGLQPAFGDLSGILSSSELKTRLCEEDEARMMNEAKAQ
ncbi:MAG: hypothetical protein AAGI27_08575 [Pseudomonadota bacterium]